MQFTEGYNPVPVLVLPVETGLTRNRQPSETDSPVTTTHARLEGTIYPMVRTGQIQPQNPRREIKLTAITRSRRRSLRDQEGHRLLMPHSDFGPSGTVRCSSRQTWRDFNSALTMPQ